MLTLEQQDFIREHYATNGSIFCVRELGFPRKYDKFCSTKTKRHGGIAQELEQALDKRQVGGANPSATTI